jgi:hypothetical protein
MTLNIPKGSYDSVSTTNGIEISGWCVAVWQGPTQRRIAETGGAPLAMLADKGVTNALAARSRATDCVG